MTPKEKAIELYNNFLNPSGGTYLYGMLEHESAKECALIAVDEIIKIIPYEKRQRAFMDAYYRDNTSYWQEVKQEIEAL